MYYGAKQQCGVATSRLLGELDTEEQDGKAGVQLLMNTRCR